MTDKKHLAPGEEFWPKNTGQKEEPMTRCVNVRHEECEVYCGRGSGGAVPKKVGQRGWLGNPIKKGEKCPVCQGRHSSEAGTLSCYKIYLWERMQEREFCLELSKLRGKSLGCWCHPNPCHTHVLKKAIEWLHTEKGQAHLKSLSKEV